MKNDEDNEIKKCAKLSETCIINPDWSSDCCNKDGVGCINGECKFCKRQHQTCVVGPNANDEVCCPNMKCSFDSMGSKHRCFEIKNIPICIDVGGVCSNSKEQEEPKLPPCCGRYDCIDGICSKGCTITFNSCKEDKECCSGFCYSNKNSRLTVCLDGEEKLKYQISGIGGQCNIIQKEYPKCGPSMKCVNKICQHCASMGEECNLPGDCCEEYCAPHESGRKFICKSRKDDICIKTDGKCDFNSPSYDHEQDLIDEAFKLRYNIKKLQGSGDLYIEINTDFLFKSHLAETEEVMKEETVEEDPNMLLEKEAAEKEEQENERMKKEDENAKKLEKKDQNGSEKNYEQKDSEEIKEQNKSKELVEQNESKEIIDQNINESDSKDLGIDLESKFLKSKSAKKFRFKELNPNFTLTNFTQIRFSHRHSKYHNMNPTHVFNIPKPESPREARKYLMKVNETDLKGLGKDLIDKVKEIQNEEFRRLELLQIFKQVNRPYSNEKVEPPSYINGKLERICCKGLCDESGTCQSCKEVHSPCKEHKDCCIENCDYNEFGVKLCMNPHTKYCISKVKAKCEIESEFPKCCKGLRCSENSCLPCIPMGSSCKESDECCSKNCFWDPMGKAGLICRPPENTCFEEGEICEMKENESPPKILKTCCGKRSKCVDGICLSCFKGPDICKEDEDCCNRNCVLSKDGNKRCINSEVKCVSPGGLCDVKEKGEPVCCKDQGFCRNHMCHRCNRDNDNCNEDADCCSGNCYWDPLGKKVKCLDKEIKQCVEENGSCKQENAFPEGDARNLIIKICCKNLECAVDGNCHSPEITKKLKNQKGSIGKNKDESQEIAKDIKTEEKIPKAIQDILDSENLTEEQKFKIIKELMDKDSNITSILETKKLIEASLEEKPPKEELNGNQPIVNQALNLTDSTKNIQNESNSKIKLKISNLKELEIKSPPKNEDNPMDNIQNKQISIESEINSTIIENSFDPKTEINETSEPKSEGTGLLDKIINADHNKLLSINSISLKKSASIKEIADKTSLSSEGDEDEEENEDNSDEDSEEEDSEDSEEENDDSSDDPNELKDGESDELPTNIVDKKDKTLNSDKKQIDTDIDEDKNIGSKKKCSKKMRLKAMNSISKIVDKNEICASNNHVCKFGDSFKECCFGMTCNFNTGCSLWQCESKSKLKKERLKSKKRKKNLKVEKVSKDLVNNQTLQAIDNSCIIENNQCNPEKSSISNKCCEKLACLPSKNKNIWTCSRIEETKVLEANIDVETSCQKEGELCQNDENCCTMMSCLDNVGGKNYKSCFIPGKSGDLCMKMDECGKGLICEKMICTRIKSEKKVKKRKKSKTKK